MNITKATKNHAKSFGLSITAGNDKGDILYVWEEDDESTPIAIIEVHDAEMLLKPRDTDQQWLLNGNGQSGLRDTIAVLAGVLGIDKKIWDKGENTEDLDTTLPALTIACQEAGLFKTGVW